MSLGFLKNTGGHDELNDRARVQDVKKEKAEAFCEVLMKTHPI
jgi:hypothetical protein